MSGCFGVWMRRGACSYLIYNYSSLKMAEEDEKTTIYVGNLPETVTKEDLFAYFWTFGEIKSVEIPRDHMTQRLRGFAFVEFDEKEDASAAIDNYDKSQFLNRTIRVRRARPLDQKPDYHQAVWANDDWMQRIQQQKIEGEKLTLEQEEKNRKLGLPIFKEVKPKQDEKPLLFIQND